jgi:hypothetical protein
MVAIKERGITEAAINNMIKTIDNIINSSYLFVAKECTYKEIVKNINILITIL